jgi:hypothetical protein
MVVASYLGFDELFVITNKDRVRKKSDEFKKYKKIKILGF